MWKTKQTKERRLQEYDRHMLRSALVSLFWGVISERKRRSKFTFQQLADRVGTNKSVVSRWFSKPHPNWRIDTIADIAGALDIEIYIEARDRATGAVYTPQGIQTSPRPTANRVIRMGFTEMTETEPTPADSSLLQRAPTSAAA
jgi:hypothetical protein